MNEYMVFTKSGPMQVSAETYAEAVRLSNQSGHEVLKDSELEKLHSEQLIGMLLHERKQLHNKLMKQIKFNNYLKDKLVELTQSVVNFQTCELLPPEEE